MTDMLVYLYAESPVHAGGTDSDGVIDLPIQRETSTRYPVIWGQSFKGALRQAWSDRAIPNVEQVFGMADSDNSIAAGLLSVGDAQLVAMPVATLQRTFAWMTSTLALSRLARKYARLMRAHPSIPTCSSGECLAIDAPWTNRPREAFGPAVADVRPQEPSSTRLQEWANVLAADCLGWTDVMKPMAEKIKEDLILGGESIAGLLFQQCTELSARVQLEAETKTVAHGPFMAEYLPSDTIMAASLSLRDGANRRWIDSLRELLGTPEKPGLIQIGGDETIGKGLIWTCLHLTEEQQ